MKRQAGLYEAIWSFENLLLATKKASRGKRHQPLVARFEFYLEQELFRLQEELQTETYQPGPFFTFEVRDPKCRRICAAPYRDRVVHHAVCNVLEPFFERRLIFDTYACRAGKGQHAAIERAQHFSRRYRYFLKCDIRKYFESIDHTVLNALLARMFKDAPLLSLLHRIIEHAPPDAKQGKGVPIGNLTSQHFANVYLGELDHYLKEELHVKSYLRYMDDFLLFADDKPTLHWWLVDVRRFLRQHLQLELKDHVTTVAPVTEGIPFLGLRIYPGVIRLQQRSKRRFRRRVCAWEKAWLAGRVCMNDLAPAVASMFAQVSHADTARLRRSVAEQSLIQG